MADQFKSMTELMQLTEENTDWIINSIDRNSNVIITAIHGGAIEPATTELAELTAEKVVLTTLRLKQLEQKVMQNYM